MRLVGAQLLAALVSVWSLRQFDQFSPMPNAVQNEADTHSSPLLSCFMQCSVPHSFFSQHGFSSGSFHSLLFSHLRSDAHINGGLSLLRRSSLRRHHVGDAHLTHLRKPLLLLKIPLSSNHGEVWIVYHGHLASR